MFMGKVTYLYRYTKENASDEEIRNAAAIANALEFIENNQFGIQLTKFRSLNLY